MSSLPWRCLLAAGAATRHPVQCPSAVKAGQTVSWHNADSITHTATQNAGAFDTGNVPPSSTTAPLRLANAGAFDYHCGIHPSMTGTVNVN